MRIVLCLLPPPFSSLFDNFNNNNSNSKNVYNNQLETEHKPSSSVMAAWLNRISWLVNRFWGSSPVFWHSLEDFSRFFKIFCDSRRVFSHDDFVTSRLMARFNVPDNALFCFANRPASQLNNNSINDWLFSRLFDVLLMRKWMLSVLWDSLRSVDTFSAAAKRLIAAIWSVTIEINKEPL